MPDEYRVRDPDTGEIIANGTQVQVNDAVNRFARSANLDFIDRGSDLLEEFTDYELFDVDIRPVGSDTWIERFSGFVVEQDYDQSQTSVDLLSHDHWLKRQKVDREFVNMDASAIVIEVVQDFSPLSVDPADVQFVDEPTGITERYKGVTPAEIIAGLTESSNNEQFGATNDLEFFLREFDAGESDLELTPGRYRSTDWEDDSRSQINQVRLKFGENGNDEVVVSDKASQQELGESIGSDTGVILEESKTFEGIPAGDTETARAKADAILERGEPIAIGEIETFNVGEVRPGQIVFVEDPAAGVSGEFRVANVELDSTGLDTLLVAENREGVIDKLADLSQEQDRIEARQGQLDPDNSTEFLTQMFDFEVEWNARLLERSFLDDALILGSERPRLGNLLQLDDTETLTVADGETQSQSEIRQARGSTLTAQQGGTLSTDQDDTAPLFNPRGGELGFEFNARPNVLAIADTETITVADGETQAQSEIDQTQGSTLSVARGGTVDTNDENRTPQQTSGGFLTDGFNNQTELTTTQP